MLAFPAARRARLRRSSIRVTGPSFTSSTAIRAPNAPRCAPSALAEPLVQRLGDLGRRGGDEARPVALAGVGVAA